MFILISLGKKQYLYSVIPLTIVILVVSLCIALANWQWQRAQTKQQRLTYIAKMQQQGVLSWSQIQEFPASFDKTGLQFNVAGHFKQDQYWLLDNRTLKGRVGYDVLALFYPKGEKTGLLLNLGWISLGASRDILPTVNLPQHQMTMKFQIKQGELAGFHLSDTDQHIQANSKRIQFIDLQAFSEQTDVILFNFMAYAQGVNDIAQPHYQAVVMPPEKHKAYAVQWLLIGLAAFIIYVFAIRSQRTSNQSKIKKKMSINTCEGELNDQ